MSGPYAARSLAFSVITAGAVNTPFDRQRYFRRSIGLSDRYGQAVFPRLEHRDNIRELAPDITRPIHTMVRPQNFLAFAETLNPYQTADKNAMVAQEHGIVIRTDGKNIKPLHQQIVNRRSKRRVPAPVSEETAEPGSIGEFEPGFGKPFELVKLGLIEIRRYDYIRLILELTEQLIQLGSAIWRIKIKMRLHNDRLRAADHGFTRDKIPLLAPSRIVEHPRGGQRDAA